jgi:hypothetical protein
MKMRKAENDGQAAGDGSNMKDGEKSVRETPAAKVAASCEKECEAGSRKPVSKKRAKDKYHTRAALEMVMSQRLAEQALDILFENPPEALAALKVSAKLGELKVLPGRAPVRASSGSERVAKKEEDAKNAKNEANRDETQAEKGPEDNIHAIDSGGENQSQTRDEDFLATDETR